MLHRSYANSKLYFRIRDLARTMRKTPTRAEKIFWERTRNRLLLGLKINRQFILALPIQDGFTKYFIADFYCHELKLVIELDGQIHLNQVQQDLLRSEIIESFGFNVLRFTNEQIFESWSFVESTLQQKLTSLGNVKV